MSLSAIGTGAVANPIKADEVYSFLRGKIASLCVAETATKYTNYGGGKGQRRDNAKESLAILDGLIYRWRITRSRIFFQICIALQKGKKMLYEFILIIHTLVALSIIVLVFCNMAKKCIMAFGSGASKPQYLKSGFRWHFTIMTGFFCLLLYYKYYINSYIS